MSDSMRLYCRSCNDEAYGPCGMYQAELQSWYDIRHELAAIRSVWCSYSQDCPKIDRDDSGNFTYFLCHHKDHDICITDSYIDSSTGKQKVYEFKKPEPKTKTPLRYFRELKTREGFKGDILETDATPRLFHQIIKQEKKSASYYEGLNFVATLEPTKTIRFVFKKEELVLLRTYEED